MRRLVICLIVAVLASTATVTAVLFIHVSPAIDTGPLGSGGIPGVLCIPGHEVTVTPQAAYKNSGSSVATIEKITLYRPHNLRVLNVYVVPVTGTTMIGSANYPPLPNQIPPGFDWAARRAPPTGISPTKEFFTVALGLERTAENGTATAIDIFYEEAGRHYHLRTSTSYQIVAARSCQG